MKNSKIKPIYIMMSYTGTVVGKLIKFFTDDTYSHVCMSLDSKLDKMYSYNINSKIRKGGGISIENIKDYLEFNNNSIMCLLAIFVKEKDYKKIKDNINKYITNPEKTSYAFSNLFNILINKEPQDENYTMSMICSQFVDSMFKIANIDLTNKSSSIVRPYDFYRSPNPKIFKLYEGYIRDYDHKKIDYKIKKLKSKSSSKVLFNESLLSNIDDFKNIYNPLCIFESKMFDARFSEDGDLIIKNYKIMNVENEYYDIVKVSKIYKNTNNIDGLKYLCAKLWFIYKITQNEIDSKNNVKQNTILKGKILNTFSQNLTTILENDETFNFINYYESTPFSDISFVIDKSTIKHSLALMKLLLR